MEKDFISKVQLDVLKEQKQSDGISQIVTGFLLVVLSAFLLQGKPHLIAVLIPLMPILAARLRNIYTYPRIGFAEMGERKSLRKVMLIVFIVIALLTFGVMLYFSNKTLTPSQENLLNLAVPIGVALVIVTIFLFRYRKEHNKALLIYGAIIVNLIAVVHFGKLHIRDIIPIILGLGLIDFTIGLVLLQRFLKKYPIIQNET